MDADWRDASLPRSLPLSLQQILPFLGSRPPGPARHAHNMAIEVINNTKQFIRPADLKSVITHRFSARNEGLKTQTLMGKCGQGGDGWPCKQYRHCSL